MGSSDQRKSGEAVESKVLGGGGRHLMDSKHSPSSKKRWKGQIVRRLQGFEQSLPER